MTPASEHVIQITADVPAPIPHAESLDPHLVSLLSPRSFEADQYRVLRHFQIGRAHV